MRCGETACTLCSYPVRNPCMSFLVHHYNTAWMPVVHSFKYLWWCNTNHCFAMDLTPCFSELYNVLVCLCRRICTTIWGTICVVFTLNMPTYVIFVTFRTCFITVVIVKICDGYVVFCDTSYGWIITCRRPFFC